MAINLGDVSFRLGADTSALTKAVGKLQNFGAAVDKMAASSDKGAKAVADAMRRQEKASGDSLRTVLNYNRRLRDIQGGEKYIDNMNRAWKRYNSTLTAGTMSQVDFQRATTRFRNDFDFLRRESYKAKENVNQFSNSLRELANSARLVEGPLGGTASRLTMLAGLADSASLKTLAFVSGMAVAAMGLRKVSLMTLEAARTYEGAHKALEGLTGSTLGADYYMAEAKEIANIAGLLQRDVVPAYTRWTAALKGTALEGQKGREIFESFAKVASTIQAPAEEVKGIFKALEQMVSKGTVQSEELRGQLGDRLAGAFQMAARSMGMTTKELGEAMKKGEVMAVDLLPKLAKELEKTYGTSAITKVMNYTAAQNRFYNSIDNLLLKFNSMTKLSQTVTKAFETMANMLTWVEKNMEWLAKIAGVAAFALAGLVTPILLSRLVGLIKVIGNVTKAIILMNTASMANPFGILLAGIGAVIGAFVFFEDSVRDTLTNIDNLLVSMKHWWDGLDSISKIITGTVIVALLGLIKTLGLLRIALMRTGIGAIIVLAGTFVATLDDMVASSGSWGKALAQMWSLIQRTGHFAFQKMMQYVKAFVFAFYDMRADIQGVVGAWLQWMEEKIDTVRGFFSGLIDGIGVIWSNLPSILGEWAIVAANTVLDVFTWLLQKLASMLNVFLSAIEVGLSNIPMVDLEGKLQIDVGNIGFDKIESRFDGTTERMRKGLSKAISKGITDAQGSTDLGSATVLQNQINNAARAGQAAVESLMHKGAADGIWTGVRSAWGQIRAVAGAGANTPMQGPNLPPSVYTPPTNPMTLPGSDGGGSKGKKKKGGGGKDRTLKALNDYEEAMAEMNEEIALFNSNPALFDKLTETNEAQKKIREMRNKLLEAGVAVEDVNAKMANFEKTLMQRNAAEQYFERIKAGFDAMQESFTSGFDAIFDKMAENIATGKKAFEGLADVVSSVTADILQTLMKLAVSNPLKNMLFGLNEATLGGGGGGGLLGAITNAIAGLFGGGRKNRVGQVMGSPTRYLRGGRMETGGEAGAEAMMPLVRDSSGRLGVSAFGGGADANITGGNVYVNVSTPEGTKAQKQVTQDSSGNQFIDIIISTVGEALGNGTYDSQMRTNYGLRPGVVKR